MPLQVCIVIGLYSVNPFLLHWFTFAIFTCSTLETLKEAYEAQSAAMKDLQAQIKMIAERQNAYLKCPDAQMEEVTVADGASGDCMPLTTKAEQAGSAGSPAQLKWKYLKLCLNSDPKHSYFV